MFSISHKAKRWLYMLTAYLCFVSLSCSNSNGSNFQGGDGIASGQSVSGISADLENLNVQYGEYFEIPLTKKQPQSAVPFD